LHIFKERNVYKYAGTEIYKCCEECRGVVKAEQPVDCCMLSCRFSLSDAGADMARQLRDRNDTCVSNPLTAPETVETVDISDDESPNSATPDGTVAVNGDIAATLTCDSKQCPAVSATISVKRKTTAAKTRDYENSHLNSVSTCN
jgi:hypothetical protein